MKTPPEERPAIHFFCSCFVSNVLPSFMMPIVRWDKGLLQGVSLRADSIKINCQVDSRGKRKDFDRLIGWKTSDSLPPWNPCSRSHWRCLDSTNSNYTRNEMKTIKHFQRQLERSSRRTGDSVFSSESKNLRLSHADIPKISPRQPTLRSQFFFLYPWHVKLWAAQPASVSKLGFHLKFKPHRRCYIVEPSLPSNRHLKIIHRLHL